MTIPGNWRTRHQRYSLRAEICQPCGHISFPPRPICPRYAAERQSGTGLAFVMRLESVPELVGITRPGANQAGNRLEGDWPQVGRVTFTPHPVLTHCPAQRVRIVNCRLLAIPAANREVAAAA